MRQFLLLSPLLFAACGDADSPRDTDSEDSGTPVQAPDAGDAAVDAAASSPDAGHDDAGAHATMALPAGWARHGSILNLVDPAAAQELEESLLGTDRPSSTGAAQRFFTYFPDEYDFLFLVTENGDEDQSLAAAYSTVRSASPLGTGVPAQADDLDYHSVSRLKGAVAVQLTDGFPPLAHELMHRWGNYLDRRFGFGQDRDYDYDAHWGSTSVFGQLGGFDQSTLRCTRPQGARPPMDTCTPEANGRIRYLVGNFGGNTNSFQSVPYAPLELYLMGLIPRSEVPATFMRLEDAAFDPASLDDADRENQFVEASGLSTIAFADIVAQHGERPLASAAERAFTSAFVLVTRVPASAASIATVDGWAREFGAPAGAGRGLAFADHTGGRATLATALGQTRAIDAPLVPPESVACKIVEQDCGPGLGCYDVDDKYECFAAGALAVGAECTYANDCSAGSLCLGGAEEGARCYEICDPRPTATSKRCDVLCPNDFIADTLDYDICPMAI